MNITVAGIGYVGLANAVLLAQRNNVIALDIDQRKVDLVSSKLSPIDDAEIKQFLAEKTVSRNNGNKEKRLFSDSEYERRLSNLR